MDVLERGESAAGLQRLHDAVENLRRLAGRQARERKTGEDVIDGPHAPFANEGWKGRGGGAYAIEARPLFAEVRRESVVELDDEKSRALVEPAEDRARKGARPRPELDHAMRVALQPLDHR